MCVVTHIFLSFKQELLIMDTGLLLAALSVYDQHHDMRLDIGNMSYEVCVPIFKPALRSDR